MLQETRKRFSYSGHSLVFRDGRSGLNKSPWHDRRGLWRAAKRREPGRFLWSSADGVATITLAPPGYSLQRIDWRMPQTTRRPQPAGEQCIAILGQACHRLGVFYSIASRESLESRDILVFCSRHRDVLQNALGLAVQALRQLVKSGRRLMRRATLLARHRPYLAELLPEAERATDDRETRCRRQAAPLQVEQEVTPGLRARTHGVGKIDQRLHLHSGVYPLGRCPRSTANASATWRRSTRGREDMTSRLSGGTSRRSDRTSGTRNRRTCNWIS